MTSRYTREHSVGYKNGENRLVDVETMAEIFHDAGYRTGAFVGNVVLKSRLGLDQGFEVYDDELPSVEVNRPLNFERIAEGTAERIRGWLLEDDERPFFVWAHFQDPNGPYLPPPSHIGRFDGDPEPQDRILPVLEKNSGLSGIPAYQELEGLDRAD